MSWWDSAPIVEMTIDDQESELRQAVDAELPERGLADTATTCLAQIIEGSAQGDRPESGSAESLNLHALMGIAVLTFRATRAAMAIVAAGYESEANRHLRSVVELHAHRKAIETDATGEEARAWLDRKRGRGITRRVQAAGTAKGLYGELSADAHGDPAGIYRRLMLVDGEARAVNWGPHRGLLSRLLLHQFSLYSLFAAKALADSAGVEVPRFLQLQKDLAATATELKRLASGHAA